MPKLEVTLTVDKVTKNTVRYREQATEEVLGLPIGTPVFPVISIRKDALKLLVAGRDPGANLEANTIKVTVEAV